MNVLICQHPVKLYTLVAGTCERYLLHCSLVVKVTPGRVCHKLKIILKMLMTPAVPHKDYAYASARSQYNLEPATVINLVAEMEAK